MIEKQRVYLKAVKRRALYSWMFIMTNLTVHMLIILFLPVRQTTEEVVYYGLSQLISDPSDITCNVVQVIVSYFIVNITVTIGALVITLAGCAEAQILALSDELHSLWDDANKDYETYKETHTHSVHESKGHKSTFIDNAISTKLKRIIDIHNFNIDQIYAIERVFGGAMAIEVTLVIVGLITDLLGGIENTFPLIPFAFVQLGLDCIAGQGILNASEAFEASVYACNWENFGVSNRKTILLMLKQAQKNMKLSAGSMTTLDYQLMMSVIQFIYSTYTTLRSFI